MKNSKLRRVLLLLASAVLLVSLSVGATLAYLTHETGEVTNTFTVGSVKFDDDPDTELDEGLDEANVDQYGVKEDETRVNGNEYKLVPGHTYVKDPTVHIADGSEECFIFVTVKNGITDIETDVEGKTIAEQMAAKNWILIYGNETDGIYAYATTNADGVVKPKVVAGEAEGAEYDVVVFDTFTLADDLDQNTLEANKDDTIVIKAYAVQADTLKNMDAVAVWNAAGWTPAIPVTEGEGA